MWEAHQTGCEISFSRAHICAWINDGVARIGTRITDTEIYHVCPQRVSAAWWTFPHEVSIVRYSKDQKFCQDLHEWIIQLRPFLFQNMEFPKRSSSVFFLFDESVCTIFITINIYFQFNYYLFSSLFKFEFEIHVMIQIIDINYKNGRRMEGMISFPSPESISNFSFEKRI